MTATTIKAIKKPAHRCSKAKQITDLDHAINGNGKKGMKIEVAEHTIQLNNIQTTVDSVDGKIDNLLTKVDDAKTAAYTAKLALDEYKREAVLIEEVKDKLKKEETNSFEKELKIQAYKMQKKMFLIALVTVIITCIGFASKMLSSEKEVQTLKTEAAK